MHPTRFEMHGHIGPDQVASRETAYPLCTGEVSARAAELVYICALIAPASLCGDRQGAERRELDACQISHAERVFGMRLFNVKASAIPAGASTTPGADGQVQHAQRFHQGKSGRVDCCRIPQRLPGLCLDLRVTTFAGRLVAYGCIAVMATEREIRHPVGAAATARDDMI